MVSIGEEYANIPSRSASEKAVRCCGTIISSLRRARGNVKIADHRCNKRSRKGACIFCYENLVEFVPRACVKVYLEVILIGNLDEADAASDEMAG